MKNKNYLCRTTDGGFFLARGEPLQEDNSLAVVRSWSEPIITPRWSIIDIASGLFVIRASTKKKLIEKWEEVKEIKLPKIKDARERNIYKAKCEELEVEQHIWRESGYVI